MTETARPELDPAVAGVTPEEGPRDAYRRLKREGKLTADPSSGACGGRSWRGWPTPCATMIRRATAPPVAAGASGWA